MSKHNRAQTPSRRALIRGGALLGLGALAPKAWSALATPKAAEGPYYPRRAMRYADVDHDLVRIEGAAKAAGGEMLYLQGHVYGPNREPLSGARVEIWQCDVNGRYLHTGDDHRVQRDEGFQGFGYFVTASDGAYQFRTIKPVSYPGRTPHIHVKVLSEHKTLTTQFYLADHPENRRDWLFQSLSEREQQLVSMQLRERQDGALDSRLDLFL